jgi:cholesterol oxidase
VSNSDADVVIIGSGFGGSICANRLALAGLKVLVLERGPWRDTIPVRSMGIKNRAPLPYGLKFFSHLLRTLHVSKGAPSEQGGLLDLIAQAGLNFKGSTFANRSRHLTLNKSGLFEIFRYPRLDVLAASGVGGGSHGWAGFLVEPVNPAYWSGRHPKLDPAGVEQYYGKILEDMKAVRLTKAHAVDNTVWAQLEDIGERCQPAEPQPCVAYKYPRAKIDVGNIEVDDNRVERQVCQFDGDCYLGSRGGARASVDFVYLAPVINKGATLLDMCEVRKIVPSSKADKPEYAVHYTDLRTKATKVGRARTAILAAGTMNTLRLLFESCGQPNGLQAMPSLGKTFGGNGDFIGLWQKGSAEPDMFKTTSVLGRFVADRRPSPFLALIGYAGVDTVPLPPRLKKLIGKTVLALGMGPDSGSASARFIDGYVEVDYQPEREGIFDEIRTAFAALQEDSGKPVLPFNKPITVHQWGGACVGPDPSRGVVDHNGEVYGNPGLFVADGAALPAAPGTPPALTISAWAHHVADRMIQR